MRTPPLRRTPVLSYRHAFHAGNHADVLKHLTLVLVLDYYRQKDKPFWYIDTHAGTGFYHLNAAAAQQNREYATGVQRLWEEGAPPATLHPYLALLQTANPTGTLQHYLGSPWLAALLLRPHDRLHLFELHPRDQQALQQTLGKDKRVRIRQGDGYAGLLGLLPPAPRRAVTLVDPAYELKSDYQQAIATLSDAYRRFATGTYLLWYPVVQRQRVNQLEQALLRSGMRDILQVEFCPHPDSPGLGMTGSGLFITNPPWVLARQLQTALPWLNQRLASGQGQTLVRQLVTE